MKLLPIKNIVYKTSLTEDEAIGRLAESVEPGFNIFNTMFIRHNMLNGSTKPYEGEMNGQAFEIRIINYNDAFTPRISGVIREDFEGSTIKVKMRPRKVLTLFFSIFGCLTMIWLLVVCIVSLFLIANTEFTIPLLIFILFVTFVPFCVWLPLYVIAMLFFKDKISKSKKDLQEIFQAEIVEEY